jgi:hypothetical protein
MPPEEAANCKEAGGWGISLADGRSERKLRVVQGFHDDSEVYASGQEQRREAVA